MTIISMDFLSSSILFLITGEDNASLNFGLWHSFHTNLSGANCLALVRCSLANLSSHKLEPIFNLYLSCNSQKTNLYHEHSYYEQNSIKTY